MLTEWSLHRCKKDGVTYVVPYFQYRVCPYCNKLLLSDEPENRRPRYRIGSILPNRAEPRPEFGEHVEIHHRGRSHP